jgi:hypothetical protein
MLAQIDAHLERDDPELAWRLKSMLRPTECTSANRRPPRPVVVLAVLLAAAAVFLTTMIVLLVPQPCRADPEPPGGPSTPATGRPSTAASGGRPPASPERSGPAGVRPQAVPVTARC